MLVGLQGDPRRFQWWAVTQSYTNPRWRHLWRDLILGLPPIGRGKEWIDFSPHRNHGTLTNFSLPADWRDGLLSRALFFDGTADFVNFQADRSLHLGRAFTIEALFKSSDVAGDRSLVAKASAADRSYWLMTTGNGVRCYATNTAGSWDAYRTSATPLSNGVWYHVKGVYNGEKSMLDIYLNGELDNGALTGTVPSQVRDSSQVLNVGSYASGTAFFYSGLIELVRIWGRDLSDGEPRELAAAPYGMFQFYEGTVTPFMATYMGAFAFPIARLMSPAIDVCSRTANEQTGLNRGSAVKTYPMQPNLSPAIDDGALTKHEQTGKVRGYPMPPYNANVRGLGKRLDKKKKIRGG